MNPERLAAAARRSLGDFCREECKAFCCRKGHLTLTAQQLRRVAQGHEDELKRADRLIPIGERFSLILDGDCPSLAGNRCSIYRSRPKACREFPLWIRDGVVFVSPRCVGVKAGLLYPYVRRLRMLGLRVIESAPYAELDLHRFVPPPAKAL